MPAPVLLISAPYTGQKYFDMATHKLGGLFLKALLVLSIVSIVPIGIIGYHVLGINTRMLNNERLERQQIAAGSITSILRHNVARKAQLFSVFTDLHSDLGGHRFIDQADIDHLRTRNPDITHISVLNSNGQQLFYSSDEKSRFSYASDLDNILTTCIMNGQNYVGSISRTEGALYSLMAFPVRDNLDENAITGVLVVELNLKEMGESLQAAYPPDLQTLVFASNGTIISYSGAPHGLALTNQPQKREEALHIERQLGARRSGEVFLQNRARWLVASEEEPLTHWTVYVLQPAERPLALLFGGTNNSILDLLVIVLGVIVFIVIVSYLVIIPITRPLERLQAAAVRLQKESDYLIKREDLEIPQNEIGDLAIVFLEMAAVLRQRKEEILKAQQALTQMNRTLEKRVEERTRELKEATRELVKAERLAAIGQMASIISHEIRNPLAVISNATRLIKIIISPQEPKLLKQFGIIDAEIKQANSIINEVLCYARSRDLILTAIDLNSYLKEIILSFPLSCGIELKEDFAPESVRIKVDAEEMKQAIRNLIANAAEAMQDHGTITVGTRVGNKTVCIFVADTGPGIKEDVRGKIFSPFFTTKARGTGLGLAVVGKAMAHHRGKIFIQSQAGKGTCFQLYLKIYKKTGDTNYGEAS